MQRGPGQSALRKGRIARPGQGYFLTMGTADREAIFGYPAAAQQVISALRWLRDQGGSASSVSW